VRERRPNYNFDKLREHELVLIAFSDEAEQYESEARQAALDEIRRRGIDISEIRSVGENINKTFEEDVDRATVPLQSWIAVIVVLTAITWVIPTLISLRISSRGYFRKTEDIRAAFRLGLILWFAAIAAFVYFGGVK
jgi:hypothetical protein